MKQLSQNLRTGKLSVDEVSPPSAQSGQILVQSAYSLISAGTERAKIETGRKSLIGKALARPDQVRQVLQSVKQLGLQSTFQKVRTRLEARSALGYSAAGVVQAVGAGVYEFHVGDRVACGGASAAHAEMIAVPRNLCVPVPDGVDLETAAFTTLGAIAMQGIRQANIQIGECVVVIGLGLLGQLAVQMLKASGCTVIGYDLNASRCELARGSGADAAGPSEGALQSSLALWTASRGADAVIITAGASSSRPVELAGDLCREKGHVVVVGAVGLTLPRESYYHKELSFSISRSYGPGRYDPSYEEKGQDYPYGYVRWTEKRNMEAFLSLAASGKVNVKPLITHRFRLDQAEQAYALISGKTTEPCLGVLFDYGQSPVQRETRVIVNRQDEHVAGRLGIGVIGAGNFAQSMLLPHLKKNADVDLRGVVTLNPLESRDVAERFGFAYMASDSQGLLSDETVTAVVIATRHDTHAVLALQALGVGKAIHLEKPLALTPEQLDQIIEAYYHPPITNPRSEIGNSFLMVGFNRRFAPMVQAVADFFSGRQEPVVVTCRVNAGFIPPDHWTQDPQQGGGRIIGEVCHFVDLIQFLAGARVQRVHAEALPDRGKYHQDNVVISLSLADGSVGTICYVANGDKALPKEYIEVYGGGKVAILDDYSSLSLFSGGKKRVSRQGAHDKGHRAETAAWVDAIRHGNPEPVPFEDAICATKATFAILRSLVERQAVSIEDV